ncbi:hypothetical protein E2C01_078167 [Portunus trituberculatus]|uniref:Uncharacterized protein n=1 Tax=Portunus trituberculatus TaxID=210409 RepID=A0A5B7IM69_PORTR|nr:hypothetical protein [Portunus trituberculatus]
MGDHTVVVRDSHCRENTPKEYAGENKHKTTQRSSNTTTITTITTISTTTTSTTTTTTTTCATAIPSKLKPSADNRSKSVNTQASLGAGSCAAGTSWSSGVKQIGVHS